MRRARGFDGPQTDKAADPVLGMNDDGALVEPATSEM